ncbi:MAG: serine/threonine protein kinase [Actinomycetales bacterium]|nr:serine/threonine protein kinase [Actinomycetales bacterium]
MSQRTPSSPPDLPGFLYVGFLGMGGFADVFRYEELAMGRRPVGVKVLLRGLRQDTQRAFEAEANAMAQLASHPHIVSVHQAGRSSDGRAYLVMEYCPPPHLGTKIRRSPLRLPEALEIGVQIAGAVETAHKAGVLHRDIKPANILFTEFGDAALTDFGIAASTAVGESGKAVGVSVPWAPPEQLTADRPMGFTADVYSLAATIYTMLAGRSPFWSSGAPNDNATMAQRILNQPLTRMGREDVPSTVERVLEIALRKRPEERYPTAAEFAGALRQLQSELHYPVTRFVVRGQIDQQSSSEEDDSGGTKVSGFVSIDPDGPPSAPSLSTASAIDRDLTGMTVDRPSASGRTGSALTDPPVLHHGRGSAEPIGPLEFTGPALPGVSEGDTIIGGPPEPAPSEHPNAAAAMPPTKPRRVGLLVGVGAAGLVALAGGLVFMLQSGDKGTTQDPSPSATSARPADALGVIVPEVTALKLTSVGGKVQVTWTNPQPLAGDTYLYRVVDPATPKDYAGVAATQVTLDAVPGRTCVEVLVRRATGRSSSAVADCVVTP